MLNSLWEASSFFKLCNLSQNAKVGKTFEKWNVIKTELHGNKLSAAKRLVQQIQTMNLKLNYINKRQLFHQVTL